MENKRVDVDDFVKSAQLISDWPKDIVRRRERLSKLGGKPLGVFDGSLDKLLVGRIEPNGHDDCCYSFKESSTDEKHKLHYAKLERVYE